MIETCKNMYQNFEAAYDVFSKVVTNFREQRCLLKEEADFLMNRRVKNIEETLSTQVEGSLTELKKHLPEIGKVFAETVAFLEEVKETQAGTVLTFLHTLLGRYRSYQQRFKYFTEKLHDLGNKLDQLITDVIPRVFDLQKQLLKQIADVQRDMKEMRKLLEKEKRNEIAGGAKVPILAMASSIGGISMIKVARFPSFHVTSTTGFSNEVSELETLLDKVEKEVENEIEVELKSIR